MMRARSQHTPVVARRKGQPEKRPDKGLWP